MPTYVSFFRYTNEAWKRMIDTPENRAVAARRTIEEIGGRMLTFYWMLGQWDGLVIYEVEDPSMAATLSAVATASGLIDRVQTSQLLAVDEVKASLDLASSLRNVYVPPGGQGTWHAEYDALG